MTARRPLPPQLLQRPFTTSEALSLGVSRGRLQGSDLQSLGRDLWAASSARTDAVSVARALVSETKGSWISHSTAAAVFGLKTPIDDAMIHISRPRGSRAPQRAGVIGHERNVDPEELVFVDGAPVSTPARIWLEMAQMLSPTELVVLGDQLVRYPRPGYEQRAEPWTTVEKLREVRDRHRRTVGIAALTWALGRIRVGSDSRPETLFRLALVAAGLPEPELQVLLDPNDPYSPSADLGYPGSRLAIQYDGAHHFSAESQARDQRRDAAFRKAGWTVLKVNRHDLAENFVTVIGQIRSLLRQAS